MDHGTPVSFVRCKLCCLPTTRPDTAFHEGICSACVDHANRPNIDWKAREGELIRILEASKNGTGFHCVVPSSAGKDSFYQTLKIIELGFRPLVVTASTCMLTEVGRKNIDTLTRYATTIEVTPNRAVRRKLNRLGLELVGDVSLPEHWAILSIPFRVAADLGIPTLIYGENPLACYGSPSPSAAEARIMTRRWTQEFGGYLGCRPQDVVGEQGITEADMADYVLPDDDKLSRVTAYWLGQYEEWSSHRNARVAKEHGMIQQLPWPANWWDFENQDCALTSIHDVFCWVKYGYGRLCAQISVDIRSGLTSREEALKIVLQRDGVFADSYMGVPFIDMLNYLGMTSTDYIRVRDKFTNHDLFHPGTLILKEKQCSQAA
jgi:N-acetyl sugar amidotransferase